jgi:two-component system, OmpR family, phosphate regulon sensor histidine kinase PhoR
MDLKTFRINRSYLVVGLSSLSLVIVLAIQVGWLYRTARIKEEIFNEKAGMVLSRMVDRLSTDSMARKRVGTCTGPDQIRRIDSMFRHFMVLYDINVPYDFQASAIPVPGAESAPIPYTAFNVQPNCIRQSVPGVSGQQPLDLMLIFPESEQFLMAEMGTPFLASVVCIIAVMLLSWRTVVSLEREKQISRHTVDLLNNFAHEFKTPLTNIALAGKMIRREDNAVSADKVRHYSAIILGENEKLRSQVEEVLSMSALERGDIHMQKTDVNVHDLIASAVSAMGVQVEALKGRIHTGLQASHVNVKGDPACLANALRNLIDNAIKYAGSRPEIVINTANHGPLIEIDVSDNGIGIDEKYREKVFEKFFRVPTGDIHNVKGFGLGLAYVKQVVTMHNGEVNLHSEPGVGSIFTITLPNA